MEDEAKQGFDVTLVCLHQNPDLDAISAYWLASMRPNIFRNIENAPIRFLSQGVSGKQLWVGVLDLLDQIQDKRVHELQQLPIPEPDLIQSALEELGVICFDVGEGRFDHHPTDREGNEGKCALDKVAEYLDLGSDLPLQGILGYIRLNDLEGRNIARNLREDGTPSEHTNKVALLEKYSFVSIISYQKAILNHSNTLFINWLCKLLSAIYEQEARFWTEIRDEFLSKATIVVVQINDKKYKIALIESSMREVGSFSRTRDGGFCTVCIHRDPKSKQTFISGSLSSEQFTEIAKFIRVTELQRRGIKSKYKLSDLVASKFELNPVWHLAKSNKGNAYIIMNGSDKALEVEPSILTMDELFVCVELGLRDQYYPPQCPTTSCIRKDCPMYRFGLSRCFKIRSQ